MGWRPIVCCPKSMRGAVAFILLSVQGPASSSLDFRFNWIISSIEFKGDLKMGMNARTR